jgi:hypothetical protein
MKFKEQPLFLEFKFISFQYKKILGAKVTFFRYQKSTLPPVFPTFELSAAGGGRTNRTPPPVTPRMLKM